MPSIPTPHHNTPQSLGVAIDASDVPSDYILAILSQCSTFPEVLIFFLKGKLTVRCWRGGGERGAAHGKGWDGSGGWEGMGWEGGMAGDEHGSNWSMWVVQEGEEGRQ